MLTITSGYSSGYLTDEVATGRENYYLDAVTDGEPPGVWWGAGAEALGLAGEVDAEVMSAVFDQLLDPTDERFADPATREQGARLGRKPMIARPVEEVLAERVAKLEHTPLPEELAAMRAEIERTQRQAVMFFDATFSVPKSVSVARLAFLRAELAAVKAGDEQAAAEWGRLRQGIDDAVLTANRAMLEAMRDAAGYSRSGAGKAMRFVRGDLVVASFKQHTSRNLDPQVHVHNAVLNRVLCADGVWRTLDSKGLYAAIQYGGAVGDLVLAEALSGLGFASVIREDGNGRELAAVPQVVMDLFSTRTRDINAAMTELRAQAEEQLGRELTGLELDALSQRVSLATRPAKQHDGETTEQMIERCAERSQQAYAGGLDRLAAQLLAAAGQPPMPGTFKERAVIEQAVAQAQERQTTFGRAELARHITMALPAQLGGLDAAQVRALVDGLVDVAVEAGDVVQVSGRDLDVAVPEALRREDGASLYAAPTSARYAAPGHVIAEEALRRAAVTRGRMSAPADAVEAWLAQRAGMLGADQAAAVRGIATSDAALTVLVGPAGTGKSHTAGALAAVWSDTVGGRVVGLAVSQAATEVLRDDGLECSSNVAAFIAAQDRLAQGRPIPGDERWRIGPADLVLVDEASMTDTAQLGQVRELVEAAGGRLLLTGDPAQLGAVGAGGMMALLASGQAETYSLGDVRRFSEAWERDASLRLRDGDSAVLADYDRRGRIVAAGTVEDALAGAARAWLGDTLQGHDSVIVCGTNDQAATASRLVRDQLVELGRVDAHGIILGRDGNLAGVGDVVMARRNDYQALRVVNRGTYVVEAVGEDGSLTVRGQDGAARTLPADYVAEDVQLGYASTAHAVQGRTVDTAHLVAGPGLGPEAVYVGLSRGRVANTAHVVTEGTDRDGHRQDPRTAAAALADALDRDDQGNDDAALAQDAADRERLASAATLAARIEDGTRIACRARLDRQLDQLAADGVITDADRARLGGDQGTEYLSRILRRAELAGHDPAAVLGQVASDPRGLDSVDSAAQALSARIARILDLTATGPATSPSGIDPASADYLGALHSRLDDRRRELGTQAGQDAPAWAVAALGPIPDDAVARLEWEDRAATLAAYREAAGWEDPNVAIGPPPGLHVTEARAVWQAARCALGDTEAHRDEIELTDGQLRARVAAGQRIRANLPAYVHQDAADAHQRAQLARQDAAIAEAAGDTERAQQATADAEVAALVAGHLDTVADVRAEALATHAATLAAARAAEAEARRRGLDERDRAEQVTAEEWLAAEARARVEDDEHRAIGEADMLDHDQDDHGQTTTTDADAGQAPRPTVRTTPVTPIEAQALAVEAAAVAEQLADVRSQDAAAVEAEHRVDDVAGWEHWREQQAAAAADDHAA